MLTVATHPKDRPPLNGQGTESREDIFQPLGHLETTMAEQAVVPQADAQATETPVEKQGYPQSGPGEEENASHQSHHVKNGKEEHMFPSKPKGLLGLGPIERSGMIQRLARKRSGHEPTKPQKKK
jgi:hypothetical protein